jgi:two-component system response regulator DevR
LRPDVAVLDARLPDGNGIDVCRDVRAVDPTTQALILTSYDDDAALFAAIMAGAAGYVLKQIRGNDLLDAVRRVRGRPVVARPGGDRPGAGPHP